MSKGNNIAALREARGWSRPDLATRMDTSPQQVERLEKGHRRLTHDWMERAARAFGVEATAIIGDLMTPITDIPRLRAPDAGDMVDITSLDLTFSMGSGTNIDDYIEETPYRFDLSFIRTFTRSETTRLRLARGVGESMFPTLISSDLVWIDTTQRTLNQQDRIWAISLFGAAAIKRLRTIGGGKVLVISDNPAVENQEVDAEDLVIGGRVIRLGRDL